MGFWLAVKLNASGKRAGFCFRGPLARFRAAESFGLETQASLDADDSGWRRKQSWQTELEGNEGFLIVMFTAVVRGAVSEFASAARGRRR